MTFRGGVQNGSHWIAILLFGIAALDLSVGLWMLLAEAPWRAHGPGTLWMGAPELMTAAGAEPLLMSLFRRMGAFSVQAALGTALVAWWSRHDLARQGQVLALWTLAGVGFGVTDGAYFDGTTYLLGKRVVGALWVAALLHWGWRWRRRDVAPTP